MQAGFFGRLAEWFIALSWKGNGVSNGSQRFEFSIFREFVLAEWFIAPPRKGVALKEQAQGFESLTQT